MRFFQLSIVALFLMGFGGHVVAGVMIESLDRGQQMSKVLIDDDWARINSGEDITAYTLLDMKQQKVYTVSIKQRVVLDLTSPMAPTMHAREFEGVVLPELEMRKVAQGPRVAGFSTVEYKVFVGGQYCFTEYLSKTALETPQLTRFIELMSASSGNTKQMALNLLLGGEDYCEFANDLVDDEYLNHGLPMRTVDAGGQVVHEIVKIDPSARFEKGLFDFPKGYAHVTRQELLRRSRSKMQAQPQDEAVPLPDGHAQPQP